MIFAILSYLLIIGFAVLAVLHFIWIFRPIASGVLPAENGVPVLRPGPLLTLAVAVMLSACAASVYALGHPFAFLPQWMAVAANACIAAAFALRAVGDFKYVGFSKTRKEGLFASRDSWIYSPLCILISMGEIILLVVRSRKG
jgi:hypothetical protein